MSETPKIEKGVPIPDGHGLGRPRSAFWRCFEIGDSAVVTNTQYQEAHRNFKAMGWKMTRRKVDGELRIWRTA